MFTMDQVILESLNNMSICLDTLIRNRLTVTAIPVPKIQATEPILLVQNKFAYVEWQRR